jgi:hypothetical protein
VSGRQVVPGGRATEVQFLGQRHEIAKLTKFHARRPPYMRLALVADARPAGGWGAKAGPAWARVPSSSSRLARRDPPLPGLRQQPGDAQQRPVIQSGQVFFRHSV